MPIFQKLLDQMTTAEETTPLQAELIKDTCDDDKRIAYYWMSQAETRDGKIVKDCYGHIIREAPMEDGAHHFMLKTGRKVGFRHMDKEGKRTGHANVVGVGTVVDSVVTSRGLQKALAAQCGGTCDLPVGWLVGLYFEDPTVWAAVKAGLLPEASWGGDGKIRVVEVDADLLTTTA